MRHHRPAVQLSPLPWLDGHLDVLAGDRVRNADYLRPENIGMKQGNSFHLAGKDLEPADVQHLPGSPDNLYIVAITLDQVACVVPSIHEW